MKQKRHARIFKIIRESEIKTQEQLTEALRASGYNVTQATVSRDIKELGLVKVPSADGGYCYAMTGAQGGDVPQQLGMFAKAVVHIDCAHHTIVVRTFAGMAPAVAATLDGLFAKEFLGSIAGDDTILIVMASDEKAEDMTKRLKNMIHGEGE